MFTSNVDGQFQRAETALVCIDECHGSIHHLQCLDGCSPHIWPADGFMPEVDEVNCLLLNEPPRCPSCGAMARPNVLMFGDFDWQEHRQEEQSKALKWWLTRVSRPVVVEIGAGSTIPSVRHFGQRVIFEHGGRLVRINPREFAVPTPRDVGIARGALEALRAIALRCPNDGDSEPVISLPRPLRRKLVRIAGSYPKSPAVGFLSLVPSGYMRIDIRTSRPNNPAKPRNTLVAGARSGWRSRCKSGSPRVCTIGVFLIDRRFTRPII